MEPVAPALEGALREGASSDAPPAPEAPEVSIPERCPIARCGAIAAQIALRPEDVDLLLEREELRQREWQAAHAHWMSAIRDEAKRGEQTLLAAYDKAYVEAIEAARGPITAADYARLVRASERGVEAEALGEMGLPKGALLRVKRVWLARIVRDKDAAKALRAAMRAG